MVKIVHAVITTDDEFTLHVVAHQLIERFKAERITESVYKIPERNHDEIHDDSNTLGAWMTAHQMKCYVTYYSVSELDGSNGIPESS